MADGKRFLPRSGGPRRNPGTAPYELLAESYGVAGRTGRIRRNDQIVGSGPNARIERFKRFEQRGGETKPGVWYRVVGVRKHYTDDGKVWAKENYRQAEYEQYRPVPDRAPVRLQAKACTCKARKGQALRVNGRCPIHAPSQEFRRLVCQCGTSFVPRERFQDCCQQCWTSGRTKNARTFGPERGAR